MEHFLAELKRRQNSGSKEYKLSPKEDNMMKDGRIILDIRGEEKKKLTVEDLLEKFNVASGEEFANDRMILG